jgi:Mn2+/Fe2+ NRAMP family transporter
MKRPAEFARRVSVVLSAVITSLLEEALRAALSRAVLLLRVVLLSLVATWLRVVSSKSRGRRTSRWSNR